MQGNISWNTFGGTLGSHLWKFDHVFYVAWNCENCEQDGSSKCMAKRHGKISCPQLQWGTSCKQNLESDPQDLKFRRVYGRRSPPWGWLLLLDAKGHATQQKCSERNGKLVGGSSDPELRTLSQQRCTLHTFSFCRKGLSWWSVFISFMGSGKCR